MESYCPICGSGYKGEYCQHHCRPKTLAAIDRATSRERQTVRAPRYGQRLAHGFMLIGLAADARARGNE